MIKTADSMRSETKSGLRGGVGDIRFTHLVEGGDTFGKSRMIAKLVMPAGASIGEHEHRTDAELYIILSGEACVTENGVTRTLGPDDAVFTGGGGTHSLKNTGKGELVLYAIIFN